MCNCSSFRENSVTHSRTHAQTHARTPMAQIIISRRWVGDNNGTIVITAMLTRHSTGVFEVTFRPFQFPMTNTYWHALGVLLFNYYLFFYLFCYLRSQIIFSEIQEIYIPQLNPETSSLWLGMD